MEIDISNTGMIDLFIIGGIIYEKNKNVYRIYRTGDFKNRNSEDLRLVQRIYF